MSIYRKVTGKRRYRVQHRWFRKPLVVLQIEVKDKGYYMDNGGGRVETIPVNKTYYIDARIEDITYDG